mmetsp:Transcript_55787/g.121458  ORF Transcript_55787/g.121458 Transcript_55787/m.121458 type:complete len:106 (+) Transcript_55787:1061-1378(+)
MGDLIAGQPPSQSQLVSAGSTKPETVRDATDPALHSIDNIGSGETIDTPSAVARSLPDTVAAIASPASGSMEEDDTTPCAAGRDQPALNVEKLLNLDQANIEDTP